MAACMHAGSSRRDRFDLFSDSLIGLVTPHGISSVYLYLLLQRYNSKIYNLFVEMNCLHASQKRVHEPQQ